MTKSTSGRMMDKQNRPSLPLWDKTLRKSLLEQQQYHNPFPVRGKVFKVLGPMLEVTGLKSSIGHACEIHCSASSPIEAEVVGFRGDHTLLMPVGSTIGIAPGDPIRPLASVPTIRTGDHLLGRVLDALGKPMDNRPMPVSGKETNIRGTKLNPFDRHVIDTPMQLGVRAMDACLPMGRGQRLGLFAGAGIGKSSLLGMLARNSDAEVNIIALIGERSREVREFLDVALGEEALKNSVVIVATSDMPPVLRVRAAYIATTIAEAFRDEGKNVLLMVDSLTRIAQSQREIGLMLGEPPASKGYTPSCFSIMADLLERSGPGVNPGDISGLYTVLIEGDDLQADPVADSAMSILDGHIILDRKIAEQGHFPAINLLRSVSRLDNQLLPSHHMQAVRKFRKKMSLYERMEDMISLGAYEHGTNPELDQIISIMPEIRRFLQQELHSSSSREESAQGLLELVSKMSNEESFNETRNVPNTNATQRTRAQ
ncbi:flagellum-specific ATP synthase [Mariprofundus micogutta]|uniref:Flagellum-specific ATP synthase n=1 Tax=Mariprofundus micogutta TaxID=1921010 RepID=A0A1L8CM76_9PROT|nr:FliI/YscN family ATPase [Mariprofundus micogutta]GAV20006.1 flagellum-specific ATP synthase [Mariprofundus micogutta]